MAYFLADILDYFLAAADTFGRTKGWCKMADAKPDDKDKELPPNTKRFKDDAAKLKDFLASFGGMAAVFYAAIEAFTSAEPYKPILALSLALLVFGALSFSLGETGYPRYGRTITFGLVGIGLVGCVVVTFIWLSSPTLIKFFEVDQAPWKRPLAQAGKKKEIEVWRAINRKTKEYLPAMRTQEAFGSGAGFEAVLILALAKEKTAAELNIRQLSLVINEYKPLIRDEWEFVQERLTFSKSFDYLAILDPESKVIYANHGYPTNPQIRDDFTVPIHVKLQALKVGIYTFSCKIEVKCHKQLEERETETIRFAVFDPEKKEMPRP